MTNIVRHFRSIAETSAATAGHIVDIARASVERDGFFSWVLSGGRSPLHLYGLMTERPFSDGMPWKRTHLFWGDERFVPPDHPYSNFRSAKRVMIDRVPLPPGNVHRVHTEASSADQAAREYEQAIRVFFRREGKEEPVDPAFHLALLGIGEDGHTASLFPGDTALDDEKRFVASVTAPEGVVPRERLTMTPPLLNRSEHLLFLVSGEEKRGVVRSILEGTASGRSLPASRIRSAGEIRWHLDFPLEKEEGP